MTVDRVHQIAIRPLMSRWDRSSERLHRFGGLGHWTGEQLRQHIATSAPEERDRVCAGLVKAAHAGDTEAELVLLRVMLPKILHLARSSRKLAPLPYRQAVETSLSAMWEAIRTYPITTTRSVLGTIALNALRIITRGVVASEDALPFGVDAFGHEVQHADPSQAVEESAQLELDILMKWAVRNGVLNDHEVQLLLVATIGTPAQLDAIARQRCVTRESVKRAVRRSRERLRQAVAHAGHTR